MIFRILQYDYFVVNYGLFCLILWVEKYLAYVYTIEFQKRGLPHVHVLFVLDYENKLTNPEMIDKYISAEIPSIDFELQQLVIKHMLHGPHTDYSPWYNKEKN